MLSLAGGLTQRGNARFSLENPVALRQTIVA
jgi:hypothetical protein